MVLGNSFVASRSRKPRHGKLRDRQGVIVDSDRWAGAMAENLETVQWRVRRATLVDGQTLGPELAVDAEDFANEVVPKVLIKLQRGRASGQRNICVPFGRLQKPGLHHCIMQPVLT